MSLVAVFWISNIGQRYRRKHLNQNVYSFTKILIIQKDKNEIVRKKLGLCTQKLEKALTLKYNADAKIMRAHTHKSFDF